MRFAPFWCLRREFGGHNEAGGRARAAYMPRMGKMRRKADLPEKTCATCGRPFTWRKKWARVWDEVRYCSDACRKRRGDAATRASHAAD